MVIEELIMQINIESRIRLKLRENDWFIITAKRFEIMNDKSLIECSLKQL